MAEPTTTTAAAVAVYAASAAAVPMLTLAGVPLGLRADELLAGFAGAVAAMALLDSVPATGDTARELVRTTLRRVMVAVASALTAGYTVPVMDALLNLPSAAELSVCFLTGGAAQRVLRGLLARAARAADGAAAGEGKA